MKLSTVLLSSAGLLVAGAAYAADLPAKKAAPAAATGCAAFGAGYIQIPGGDTCLSIGGSFYVTGDAISSNTTSARTATNYGMAPEFDLTLKAKNNTEAGAVSSKVQLDFTKAGVGFDTSVVNFGGLDFGYQPTAFVMIDGGATNLAGGTINDNFKAASLHYTANMGATSLMFGVENGSATFNNQASTVAIFNGAAANTPVSQVPDLVAKATFDAGGGAKISLVGGAHQVYGAVSGSAWGYAGGAMVSFDVSKDTNVSFDAATANGALGMIGLQGGSSALLTLASGQIADSDDNSANLANGYNLEASITQKIGAADTLGLYAGYGKANANGGTFSGVVADGDSFSAYQFDAAYKHTIAKGLWVTPEVLYTSVTQDSTQNAVECVVRIGRDV